MNMKFKKFALVLAIVLMAGTLTPAFASPFADVPADHWAYDAIVQLAAAGLIEGYPDGTYGGSRMMTRYEAAMVFARALQRLEGQIAAIDLLPELDKIKAELMAEIEAAKAAAAAAAEKQPIETTVVERVIVEKELDEEAAARIRAAEVATEALAGDMAYLEARMLGLMDGIRYDLEQLKAQQEAHEAAYVEPPSMDEIEALIAKRIEESILEAAAAAKETTIIERVVATTPELTKEDVEFIAEALIRTQVQRLELMIEENRAMIAALSDWVNDLDSDVSTLKEDVAGLKRSVAELEKIKMSGSLSLKGEKKVGAGSWTLTQTGKVSLTIKASDATTVKTFVDWELAPFDKGAAQLNNYYVEVTSSTPLSRLLVGKILKANLSPFGYVLASADYGFGGLAKVDIIDNLSAQLLIAQKGKDDGKADAALALEYKFSDAIGLRLKGKATKPYSGMFEGYAAGAGLFGKVAGIEYTGDFAMDFDTVKEKNYIGVATLKTEFSGLKLDGKVVFKEKNYDITKPLVNNDDNRLSVEGGVETKLSMLTLKGRAYYEGLPEKAVTGAAVGDKDILAFRADASASFDLFVPVTVTAEYSAAKQGSGDMVQHALAKIEVAKTGDYGLRYGVNAAYEKNLWDDPDNPNWKDPKQYTTNDEVRIGANIGYGLDLSSAKFDVDYKAAFTLPTQPKDQNMTLTHKLDIAYGFTKDVKLTFGGTVKQTIAGKNDISNQFGYTAGLTVAF